MKYMILALMGFSTGGSITPVDITYYPNGYYFDSQDSGYGELLCVTDPDDNEMICVPITNYNGDVALPPLDTD
jgi:hypothetical protein